MRFYLRALSYFKRDVKWVVALLLLVIVALGLQLLSALPQAIFLDVVFIPENTRPKDDWLYRIFLLPVPSTKLGQVIGITLVGMFIKISLDTIGMIRQMICFHINYRGTALARQELFEKYEGLSMGFHKDQAQGDAIYRLSQDTGGFYGVLDAFISSGIALVYLAVMTFVMFERNAPLAAFALSITPLMIWTNLHFGRTIKNRATASKQLDADFMTFTQRSLSAMSLIQMFRRERPEAQRFSDATARSIRGWWRLRWQEQLYPLTVNLIYALGGAIVFGYGGWLVYRDRYVNPIPNGTSVADLAVIMAWLGGIWEPLKTLTGFYANVQTHKAAGERVFKIVDTPNEIVDAPHAVSMPPVARELALRNVEFQYSEERPVLRGVSAAIKPGEMVAFVGPSGAGKSTILNLLLRFYDPTRGALTLGGYDLRDIKLLDLRKHLALVPQDSLIIPATVADNIAFGRPDATFEQIHHAATLAGAADFISELPDRYYTMLGENGGNLSGGQRQRLAIARALLTDAPILVFDEPTSALDPTQERLILHTLEGLRRHRTIVLVTHRLRSVESCDRIFVLNKGHIAEQGSHEQLMAGNGLYANLVRLQNQSEA